MKLIRRYIFPTVWQERGKDWKRLNGSEVEVLAMYSLEELTPGTLLPYKYTVCNSKVNIHDM